MPSFTGGTLAIVTCPDADGLPALAAATDMPAMAMPGMAMPHADHGRHDAIHQVCPYAAAASLVGIDLGTAGLATPRVPAALPPPAHALPVFYRHAIRDRPPAQGPPVLA